VQSPEQSVQHLTEKAWDYISAGVRLVWLVHQNKDIVGVFRPGQTESETIQPGGILDGEDVIPGFKIALRDLFK
jgi:Uma2 family endonuclease